MPKDSQTTKRKRKPIYACAFSDGVPLVDWNGDVMIKNVGFSELKLNGKTTTDIRRVRIVEVKNAKR